MGVSFVSIFVVSYHLVYWVGGAARSLAWDYLPGVPQGIEAELRYAWYEKPIGGFIARHVLRLEVARRPPVGATSERPEAASVLEEKSGDEKEMEKTGDIEANLSAVLQVEQPKLTVVEEEGIYETDPDIQLARRTSRLSVASQKSRRPSLLAGATPLPQLPATPPPSILHPSEHPNIPVHRSSYFERLKKTLRPLSAAVTPITTSLAISLPIALIPDLKALFVNTTDQGGPDWHGPDGNPPLNFVYTTGKHFPIATHCSAHSVRAHQLL